MMQNPTMSVLLPDLGICSQIDEGTPLAEDWRSKASVLPRDGHGVEIAARGTPTLAGRRLLALVPVALGALTAMFKVLPSLNLDSSTSVLRACVNLALESQAEVQRQEQAGQAQGEAAAAGGPPPTFTVSQLYSQPHDALNLGADAGDNIDDDSGGWRLLEEVLALRGKPGHQPPFHDAGCTLARVRGELGWLSCKALLLSFRLAQMGT
jgi:hypothetical protein